jgi:pyridoxamine 5'-phosphate oxidase
MYNTPGFMAAMMQLIDFLRRTFSLGKGVVLGMPHDAEQRDPFDFFGEWFSAADDAGLLMPEAMALSTADSTGRPSSRMVLMKSFDENGFVFFTNYGSRKAGELDANPQAALLFHWTQLQRQVRIEGSVERVTREESLDYFRTRIRGSQLGAWASRQSQPLSGRHELEQREKEMAELFEGQEVPLPDFWGGYRLRPDYFEFWQGRANRLHDRVCFIREGDGWETLRRFP